MGMSQAEGAYGRLVLAEEAAFGYPPGVLLHACEAAWDELVDGDVTASADTSVFKVGTKSAKFVLAAGIAALDIIATDDFAAKDLSAATKVTAWVRSSVALAAGDVQLLLDEHASCASPVETLNIPALVADTWTQIALTLATPASDNAIISVGLKLAVDKGAMSFWIDDIRSSGAGAACEYFPFLSESLRMNRNLYSSNAIRSTRNPNMPTRGNKEVGGDLTTELNPYMGLLLKHLLGTCSSAGGPAYTHTIKIGTLPTSLQVEKQFTDLGQYFRYNGCRVDKFDLTLKPEGILESKFSILGKSETVLTSAYATSPTDNGHTPFDGYEATISQGGVSLGTCTEVSMTVDNGLDGTNFVIDGTGYRYSIPAAIVKVTGTVKALFTDPVLYNLAVAHTETSLQIVLTKGTGAGSAGNEKLTFNFDEVIFRPQAPVISGPKGVLVDLPFEAYYNNDADASALWIELKNTIATY